jgi:hypothetical protein
MGPRKKILALGLMAIRIAANIEGHKQTYYIFIPLLLLFGAQQLQARRS